MRRDPRFVCLVTGLRALAVLACLLLGAPARPQTPGAVRDAGLPTQAELQAAKKELEAEKARGKTYRDKAAKEKGAVRTKSGLVFIPLKKGTGPKPTPTSTVKIDQTAATIYGRVFDESPQGKPLEADLTKVIPCWREGIPKINVGGKAKLVCPPELAFGDKGAEYHFPSGATIVYEIEVFEIVKK